MAFCRVLKVAGDCERRRTGVGEQGFRTRQSWDIRLEVTSSSLSVPWLGPCLVLGLYIPYLCHVMTLE
jgi:hypothetical protein